jgi:hypothetical protein
VAQQALVIAVPPLAFGFAANPCGFGPRGFYYNEGSTHQESDAFAIDFTRYRPNVPYVPESGGTPVLAARGGIVINADPGATSGDPNTPNVVEIEHVDPANPTDTKRFRSRYFHLAGPNMLTVAEFMPVITGQRLGLMDDTGNSLFDHLHYSIHDRNLPFPGVSFGRSVRPSRLSGQVLNDDDNGACVTSSNIERLPGLNFLPKNISFNSASVGSIHVTSFVVENTTGSSVNVSFPQPAPGSAFKWKVFSGVLANGAEKHIQVEFRPQHQGPSEVTLKVFSTAPGSPHLVRLTGTGT